MTEAILQDSASDAPPSVMPVSTAPDLVTAYHDEVAALAALPVPADYVDPHVADRMAGGSGGDEGERDPDAGGVDDEAVEEGTEDAAAEAEALMDPLDGSEDAAPAFEGSRPPQFRLRPKTGDVVGEAALRLMRRDSGLTLEDAVAQARSGLGMQAEAGLEHEADEAVPAVEDLGFLEAERHEVKRLRQEAMKWMDHDRLVALEGRLEVLDEELIPQAREAEARRVQEESSVFEASAAQAAELYPDACHAASALHRRMVEIEQDLMAAGDPLVWDPVKPLRIAQMAARDLSIAPRRRARGAPSAVAENQEDAPVVHAQARPGAARMGMTAPLTGPGARIFSRPAPAYERQIAAIASEEDYLAAKQALFGLR